MAALDEADRRIEGNPSAGLTAPRPYPRLAQPGVLWVKAGRYWVYYTTTSPPVIVGVFYETANIPGACNRDLAAAINLEPSFPLLSYLRPLRRR